MKFLFVVIYLAFSTQRVPCPDGGSTLGVCSVNHGTKEVVSKVEVLTTDPGKVSSILKDHPDAKVDTFVLTPFLGWNTTMLTKE